MRSYQRLVDAGYLRWDAESEQWHRATPASLMDRARTDSTFTRAYKDELIALDAAFADVHRTIEQTEGVQLIVAEALAAAMVTRLQQGLSGRVLRGTRVPRAGRGLPDEAPETGSPSRSSSEPSHSAAARDSAGGPSGGGAPPGSVGAMRRLVFDAEVSAQRHPPGVARRDVAAGPRSADDAQSALDGSLSIGENTSRRVGICDDGFIVFDEHAPGLFHGHIRTWGELTQRMQAVLRRERYVDNRGRVILFDDE